MTECYRCGQEGHTRAQCPQDAPLPPAAPASGRAAVPRLPAPDPAIARTWAQVIRDTLGFPPRDDEGEHHVTGIPEAEMHVRSLPGRGLEYVRPHELGLEALCDCATTTILRIDPDEAAQVTETREVPFECEGCHTVHWLTFTPRAVTP